MNGKDIIPHFQIGNISGKLNYSRVLFFSVLSQGRLWRLIGTTLTATALEYIMTGSEGRLEMFSMDTDHTYKTRGIYVLTFIQGRQRDFFGVVAPQ